MANHLTRHWLFSLILTATLLCSCSDISLQASAPTLTSDETSNASQESQVLTSIEYIYHPIAGSTGNELRAQMDQLGRTDESGHHWDAYTEWYVNWSYPYSTLNNNCTTGPIKVQVEITFTFPQWSAPENATQDLIDKWNAYLNALQLHEDGHRQIATQAGYEILRAINALPAYPSCAELEQAADTTGEDILEQYRQQEAIYDQNTEHGVTQGVHFP